MLDLLSNSSLVVYPQLVVISMSSSGVNPMPLTGEWSILNALSAISYCVEPIKNTYPLAVILFLCLCASWIIYQTVFHPLARYPGPFLAKLTRLPAVYHAIRGTGHQRLYNAHQRYGPIVRCGPNHISINSAAALNSIYGAKANVRKSTWYTVFFGDTVFNVRDEVVHARKRRVMAHAFSNQAVQEVQPAILDVIRDWVSALADDSAVGDAWSSPKDMSAWSAWVIFDSLGSLLFGNSFNTTRSVEQRPFLTIMANNIWFYNVLGQIPLLHRLKLGMVVMRDQGRKLAVRLAFAREKLRRRIDLDGRELKARPRDLVHYLMRAKDPESGKGYDEQELVGEINLLLVAGSDTTNTALASLWYFLARHPKIVDRLTKSIRDQFVAIDDISSGQVLTSNTYLKACVDEALRLCPPVPMLLPREVCEGGLDVMGHYFSCGTIIGVPTYTLHHNENYFEAPFEYRPERWLITDNEGHDCVNSIPREQREAFIPFSVGPRACMGRYIALLEIYAAVAQVLFNYDIRIEPGSEHAGAGPHGEYAVKDFFIVGKEGPILQFRKRGSKIFTK